MPRVVQLRSGDIEFESPPASELSGSPLEVHGPHPYPVLECCILLSLRSLGSLRNPDHTAPSPWSTLADEVPTHGQNAADGVILGFLFSARTLSCRNLKRKAVCSVPGQPNQPCFYILLPHQVFL